MARKGTYARTLTLPDGTRKYFYGKTKREANAKYEEAKLQLKQGIDISQHMTFGEYAQMWFDTYKRGKVAVETETNIKQLLNSFVMPVLSRMEMSKITPVDCAKVFSYMDNRGYAKSTELKTRNLMSQVFNTAVENGVIVKSPLTRSVKAGGRKTEKKKALTPAQTKTVLKAVAGSKRNLEWFVIIALGTGLRRGEIFGLQWSDVDMESCEICVRHNLVFEKSLPVLHEYTKTASGQRKIPFTDDVKRAFAAMLLQKDGEYVFHEEGGSPTAYRTYTFYDSTLNRISGDFKCSPHILRHTCITNWFDVGLDVKEVQYLAGHANAQITLDVYTDYLTEKRYDRTKERIQCTTGVPLLQAR